MDPVRGGTLGKGGVPPYCSRRARMLGVPTGVCWLPLASLRLGLPIFSGLDGDDMIVRYKELQASTPEAVLSAGPHKAGHVRLFVPFRPLCLFALLPFFDCEIQLSFFCLYAAEVILLSSEFPWKKFTVYDSPAHQQGHMVKSRIPGSN